MFLLKRATTVVLLVTTLGILLSDVYIQPVQGDGDVKTGIEAELQPEVQHAEAEPARAQGLKCHRCYPCSSDTDIGQTEYCKPNQDICVWGQARGEKTFPFRACAIAEFVEKYSCDKYAPSKENKNIELRVCSCKRDFCNKNVATSRSSSSSAQKPLPFLILVPVSLFGLLMK